MEQRDEIAVEVERPAGGKALKLKVDWRGLGKALTKGLIALPFGKFDTTLSSLVDAADAIRGKPDEPLTMAQEGWLLLHRATLAALAWTIRSSPALADRLANSDEEIEAFVAEAQADEPLELTFAFFARPAESSFLTQVTSGVGRWLTVLGTGEEERERIVRRLSQEFPIALDLEERHRRDDYRKLAAFFQPTLADEAAKGEFCWRKYRARLVDEVRKPILNVKTDEDGAVSLQEIFVPARAAYTEPMPDDKASPTKATARSEYRPEMRHVFVWLESHIDDWLKRAEPKDAFRVLSGDPGCGKSAFGMMAAARWAREGRRVLRVPLDWLDFERDAFQAISRYAKHDDRLGCDPFEAISMDNPLILILDGLDELSRVSEQSGAVAKRFVDELYQKMFQENHGQKSARVLVLLAGRPIVTRQSTETFRDPGQRVEILHLHVDKARFSNLQATKELTADQRDQWWRNYGTATRQPITGLPEEYRNRGRQIDEITGQPLLNYLLALVREDRLRTGSTLEINSIHELYTEVFELLYKRKKGQLATKDQAQDRFELSDYKRLLEEVAIAAWHTGDRSVTDTDLKKRFQTIDDRDCKLIEQHFGTLESGVFAILNSFFVAPDRGGPGVFSFTHKSFREFLTASRLVREVETICELRNNSAARYSKYNALSDWYALTGPSAMTEDLLHFLRECIAAREASAVTRWRKTLQDLFEVTLREGMPGYDKATSFRVAESCDRNAEVGLFLMMTACSQRLLREGGLAINWGEYGGAEFLLRAIGVRADQRLVLASMNHIDWSKQSLFCANLVGANLAGANLAGANLIGANLAGANLAGANLVRANLDHTNLAGADLAGANLEYATLDHASFSFELRKAINVGSPWRS